MYPTLFLLAGALFSIFPGSYPVLKHALQQLGNQLLQKTLPLLAHVDHLLMVGLVACLVLDDALIGDQAEGEHLHVAVIGCDHFVYGGHAYGVRPYTGSPSTCPQVYSR